MLLPPSDRLAFAAKPPARRHEVEIRGGIDRRASDAALVELTAGQRSHMSAFLPVPRLPSGPGRRPTENAKLDDAARYDEALLELLSTDLADGDAYAGCQSSRGRGQV